VSDTSEPTSAELNPYAPPVRAEPILAQRVEAAGDLPARRPRVWPVFVGFVVCLVLDAFVVAMVVVAIAVYQHAGADPAKADFSSDLDALINSPTAIWVSLVITSLILAAVAIGGALLSPVPLRERLNLHRPHITWFGMLLAIAGTLAVGTIFTAIDGFGVLPKSETLTEIGEFIEESTPIGFLFSILMIGLAPGLDEELMFRGYMQTRLVERWGAAVGILITSILFGVLHLDLVQGAFAAGMGLLLGYLTLRVRSIVPAMICHAVNNTISTVAEYIFGTALPSAEVAGGLEETAASDVILSNAILLAGGCGVLAMAVLYFNRNAERFAERNQEFPQFAGPNSMSALPLPVSPLPLRSSEPGTTTEVPPA